VAIVHFSWLLYAIEKKTIHQMFKHISFCS